MYTLDEYLDMIDADFECELCGHTCDMQKVELTELEECVCPFCGHIDGDTLIN